MVEKEVLTYENYYNNICILVENIKSSNIKFDFIYGIPRGGLPIAVHLSHYLDIPMLRNIFVEETLLSTITGRNLLICDDISDTGITIKNIKEKIKYFNPSYACIYYKPHTKEIPNFYVKETNKWIVFPWEKIDEIPNR